VASQGVPAVLLSVAVVVVVSQAAEDVGKGVAGAAVVVLCVVVVVVVVAVVVGYLGRRVVALLDRVFGGKRRRYLGGGPGRLRRLELGQLCRPHSARGRGLVAGSQGCFGNSEHVTDRDRTAPPHVTGH